MGLSLQYYYLTACRGELVRKDTYPGPTASFEGRVTIFLSTFIPQVLPPGTY